MNEYLHEYNKKQITILNEDTQLRLDGKSFCPLFTMYEQEQR